MALQELWILEILNLFKYWKSEKVKKWKITYTCAIGIKIYVNFTNLIHIFHAIFLFLRDKQKDGYRVDLCTVCITI